MHVTPLSKSGATRVSTLGFVVVLAGLMVLGYLWLRRQKPSTPRVETEAAVVEVSRTNLVLLEGRLRRVGESNAFNGVMVEHYLNGLLRSRSAITNGLLNGVSQGWYTNGQLQVMEHFKEGVSHGTRTKWHASGARQSEGSIVDGKFNGTFRQWHENGVLSEQIEFVAGEPDGISLAYFPSGCLKARVVMKAGKPVEQEFWKDGEKDCDKK